MEDVGGGGGDALTAVTKDVNIDKQGKMSKTYERDMQIPDAGSQSR